MKVIPATEKTKDGINRYDIIIGTGLIFDYKNKKVFYCSDDKDQWSDNSLILDIEGTTVIFYVIETLSYDVVKDMAEVIRIQEIENDLDYMKSHEEHGYSCSGCDFEQSDINNVPCNNCVNYSNYTHEDKNKSYNEIVNDFIPPVNDKECPSCVNPTTWNAMINIQKSINDFFSNLSNPKTLNTKTGCLEYMTFENLKKDINTKKTRTIGLSGPLSSYKTPTMEAREHAKVIIDSIWSHQITDFCIVYGITINSQDDLQVWIEWCENYIMTHDNLEIGEDPINHIFYHLMKLKKLYNL